MIVKLKTFRHRIALFNSACGGGKLLRTRFYCPFVGAVPRALNFILAEEASVLITLAVVLSGH